MEPHKRQVPKTPAGSSKKSLSPGPQQVHTELSVNYKRRPLRAEELSEVPPMSGKSRKKCPHLCLRTGTPGQGIICTTLHAVSSHPSLSEPPLGGFWSSCAHQPVFPGYHAVSAMLFPSCFSSLVDGSASEATGQYLTCAGVCWEGADV